MARLLGLGRQTCLGILILSNVGFTEGRWGLWVVCYVSRQSFISLTTTVCFLTTCTGCSIRSLYWNAGWHGKFSAKQARGPNSLSKYFPKLLTFRVSAHVFLGTHHTVLHLQAKLWACGEKSCCASAAPCQLLHMSNSSVSLQRVVTSFTPGPHPAHKCQLQKTVPKKFKSDLHLTMVWQGGLWLAFH